MGELICTAKPQENWEWDGILIGGSLSSGDAVFQPFEHRCLGTHIIGAPGGGKSYLMVSMVLQDILRSHGREVSVVFIDPHGTACGMLLNLIATHGLHETVTVRLIDSGDLSRTVGIDPFWERPGGRPDVIAPSFRDFTMKALFNEDPADKPQTSTTLKMLAHTLYEFKRPLTDAIYLLSIGEDLSGFRAMVAAESENAAVRQFWAGVEAAKKVSEREAILGSSSRRLCDFLVSDVLQRMFSQKEHVLNMREIMDNGEILLVNLATGEGRLSEDEQKIIGAMIMHELRLSAQGRDDKRDMPCMVYIDEVHRFITDDLARLFFEDRKRAVYPIIAHQFLSQLEMKDSTVVLDAVMQARTKIVFSGLSGKDLKVMAPEMVRGTLNLDKPRYMRHEVSGHLKGWAFSRSENEGWQRAIGSTSSQGGSTTRERGRTKNSGETDVDGASRGVAFGRNRTVTESESSTSGWANTESESETETAGSAVTVASSDTQSSGESLGGAEAFISDYQAFVPVVFPHTASTVSSSNSFEGSAHSDTTAATESSSHSTTRGSSRTESGAETIGLAVCEGESETDSFSLSKSLARSRHEGDTRSVARGKNWRRDRSVTNSESGGRTEGGSEILVPQLREIPGAYLTVEELHYRAEVALGHQPAGTCTVRMDLPENIELTRAACLYLQPGYATDAHVAFVDELLKDVSFFTTPAAPAALQPSGEYAGTVEVKRAGSGSADLSRVDVKQEIERTFGRLGFEPDGKASVHARQQPVHDRHRAVHERRGPAEPEEPPDVSYTDDEWLS